MKKIVLISALMMVILASAEAHRNRHYQMTISFQTFYDELYPYGDWLYTPEYGYVWRPYFDQPDAFRPYSSNGDWIYTDYGWTWVSDYRWGWAPFHYGRWYFDNYLGWMWIPGYEWAPAWVSWGSYNNYWGWAPLGPGIYVNVDFHWNAPDFWWTFIPCRHFGSHNWRHHIYDRNVHVTNITNITNIYVDNSNRSSNHWFRGPRVNDVERYTNTRVRRMQVDPSDTPGNARISNDRVSIYRPAVERNNERARPQEYRNAENVRPATRLEQRNPGLNDPGANRDRTERDQYRGSQQTREDRKNFEPGTQPGRPTRGEIRNTGKDEERRLSERQDDGRNNRTIREERKESPKGIGNSSQAPARKNESGFNNSRGSERRKENARPQEQNKVQRNEPARVEKGSSPKKERTSVKSESSNKSESSKNVSGKERTNSGSQKRR